MSARIHYFRGRGLAEQVRFVLAATGEPFENVYVETKEAIDTLRAEEKLLWNQLPLLEIDGLNLVQSMAELRYLARKHKIYGDSDAEAVLVDEVTDGLRDFLGRFTGAAFEGSEAARAQLTKQWMPKYLPRIERILATNPHNARTIAALTGGDAPEADASGGGGGGGGGDGAKGPSASVLAQGPLPANALFFVGSRLSLPDITATEVFLYCLETSGDALDAFPLCAAHLAAMREWAPLKAFLASDKRHPPAGAAYVESVRTVLA